MKFRVCHVMAGTLAAFWAYGAMASFGRDGGWQPIATSHREAAFIPEVEGFADQVAYDVRGNLHFVYVASAPGERGSAVYYRHLDRSAGVPGPALPLPSSGEVNLAPMLRLDEEGRVHITWLEVSPREDRNVVRYARLIGEKLAVDALQGFPVGRAKPYPRLEIAPGGRNLWCLFAVGEKRQPWKIVVMGSTDGGDQWAAAGELACGLSCGDRRIRTLRAPESQAWLVIWSRRVEAREQVMARLWTPVSGWMPEQVVSDPEDGMVRSPRVTSKGDTVAVGWEIRRLNQRRVAVDISTDGGRTWGTDRTWTMDAEQGDFGLFRQGGRFHVVQWETVGPRLSPRSVIRVWPVEESTPSAGEKIFEMEGAIVEMAVAPNGEGLTLVGLVQRLDEPLRLMKLDGGSQEPSWLDLEGRGVYYDRLGVSQGAFGGRFVAGFRRHRPVGFMRGASMENAVLILAELEAAESVESEPGG